MNIEDLHWQQVRPSNWFAPHDWSPSPSNAWQWQRLVNARDGVQLEIERDAKLRARAMWTTTYWLFPADSKFNIMGRQLESVHY